MYIFQMIFFICTIILGILIAAYLATLPILNPNVYYTDKARTLGGFAKIIWFIIVIGLTIWVLKPYFLDIPPLIKGDFYYVTGTVHDIKRKHKDPLDYVYINGKEVTFFFDSNVEKNSRYKIGYLPNTSRAIYGIKLDNYNVSHGTKIGFPYKAILWVIGCFGVFILLVSISPYLKLKLFILVSILFYPTYLYLYIKQSIASGVWFLLKNNEPLISLLIGFISILTLLFLYLSEKHDDDDFSSALVFAQVVAILKIGMLIYTFIDM